MPILFNSILSQIGISPSDVILLRHQDLRSGTLRTPYKLWRDYRSDFEIYQSMQTIDNRSRFDRGVYWASFVVTLDYQTLFAGLYHAEYTGVNAEDRPWVHADGVDIAGTSDQYKITHDERLADLEGKLFIEWGLGTRSWIQRAGLQNKPVLKLLQDKHNPPYPGHLNFIESLLNLPALPQNWAEILRNSQGVYLLTCPKTREQYVGSAAGVGGFWQRWMHYVETGHGDNVALKSRELVDYQVSILEVAGSFATRDDVLIMESRWKQKLQSRDMGLNRN